MTVSVIQRPFLRKSARRANDLSTNDNSVILAGATIRDTHAVQSIINPVPQPEQTPGVLTRNVARSLTLAAMSSIVPDNNVALLRKSNDYIHITKKLSAVEDFFACIDLDPKTMKKVCARAEEWAETRLRDVSNQHVGGASKQEFDQVSQRAVGDQNQQSEENAILSLPDIGELPSYPGAPADAEAFFEEHWAKFLSVGLNQKELRARDAKLMRRLSYLYTGQPDALSQIIPSRSFGIDEAYQRQFGKDLPPKGTVERQNALKTANSIKSTIRKYG